MSKEEDNTFSSVVSPPPTQESTTDDAKTSVQEQHNNNTQNPTELNEDTKSQLVNAFADVTKVSSSQAEEYLQNANWELQVAVRQYFDHNDTTFGETSSSTADSIASHITEIRKKASELSIIAQQKAKENLGFVGQGVSKGWGTLNRFLDNVFHMKEEDEEQNDIHKRYANMTTQDWELELQKAFPNWNKENSLIDAFPCSLMQRYRCMDNEATVEQIIEFPGVLFLTVGKVAFQGSLDQTSLDKFGVMIGLDEISRIQKGKEGRIRLVLKNQTSFIFSHFKDQVEFESALGILEHIWESSHTTEVTKRVESEISSSE